MSNRTLIAFLVVLTGGIVSFFILFRGPSGASVSNGYVFSSTSSQPSVDSSYEVLDPSILPPAALDDSSSRQANLTDVLADSYLREILAQNPEGPTLVEGEKRVRVPDVSSLEDIAESGLTAKIAVREFSSRDVRVSSDNSKEAQLAYIKQLESVTTKNFSGFRTSIIDLLDGWMTTQNPALFDSYLQIVSKQIDGLLQISTPSLWTTFHVQHINMWQKKLTLFTALSELENDPLKAYVALQEIPAVFDEGLDLQSVLEEKIDALST